MKLALALLAIATATAHAGTLGGIRYQVRATHPRNALDYTLAIRSGDRWFESQPIEIELVSDAAGSSYTASLDSIRVRRGHLPDGSAAVELVVRETIRKYCNECDRRARRQVTQTTHRTLTVACGTDTSGAPACG